MQVWQGEASDHLLVQPTRPPPSRQTPGPRGGFGDQGVETWTFCKWRVHSSLFLQTAHRLPEQGQGDRSRAGEAGAGDQVPAPGPRDTPRRDLRGPCLVSKLEARHAHTHTRLRSGAEGHPSGVLVRAGAPLQGPGHPGPPEDVRAACPSRRARAAGTAAAASRGQKRGNEPEPEPGPGVVAMRGRPSQQEDTCPHRPARPVCRSPPPEECPGKNPGRGPFTPLL